MRWRPGSGDPCGSDLDLLIRAPQPLPTSAGEVAAAADGGLCHPGGYGSGYSRGGFALNEWLRDGAVKTSQGPQLVRDLWGREES